MDHLNFGDENVQMHFYFTGCFFDGRQFENGAKFNLSSDTCVQCVCKVKLQINKSRE